MTGLTQRAAFFTRAWWRAFRPARTRINSRERLRIVIGSLLLMRVKKAARCVKPVTRNEPDQPRAR